MSALPLTKNIILWVFQSLYKEGESQTYKPSFAIDTGSAIKGENRADLFTGNGKSAEEVAGILKKKLLLYVLIPYID